MLLYGGNIDMKKWGKATVVADSFEIISCEKRSGERINWRKEAELHDRIINENNQISSVEERAEFEDRLYLECGLGDTIKTDFWTDEKHIYSFQVWYAYVLKVRYTYRNRSYEGTVSYETEIGRLLEDCKLDVRIRRDEPQEILYISEHFEPLRDFFRFLFPWFSIRQSRNK